jgi:hypothetical protein
MILSDEALLSEISTLEGRRYDAMIQADVTHLSTVFDDRLIYTHSSGKRQDGADYLRRLAAGDDVYHKISHGIDRIVRLADSLLVYGWQRINVETAELCVNSTTFLWWCCHGRERTGSLPPTYRHQGGMSPLLLGSVRPRC